MEFLTRPITSDRLEKKGQSLYKWGKILSFCGLCGFVLLALSILITLIIGGGSWVVGLLCFDIGSEYGFMYLIMPVSYIGTLLGCIGVPMYFKGLSIFALAKIVQNTDKE